MPLAQRWGRGPEHPVLAAVLSVVLILALTAPALAIMRAGGLPDRRAVGGLYLLWVIVNGFSLEETRTGDPERAGPDLSSEVTRYFASLPGDRFPNLVAAAGEFAKTDWDERFELLIRTFIDGLAAQARLS